MKVIDILPIVGVIGYLVWILPGAFKLRREQKRAAARTLFGYVAILTYLGTTFIFPALWPWSATEVGLRWRFTALQLVTVPVFLWGVVARQREAAKRDKEIIL